MNALVKRNADGALVLKLNEEEFRECCIQAADYLKKARGCTDDIPFRLYLDAKIEELRTGTDEARRIADYFWIRHDHTIDIVISSAIEVYLDNWKNLKGSAAACVTLENTRAEEMLKQVLCFVPEMELSAPWKNRRHEIDPEALPKLKFVDIVLWTGDYVFSPMTILAQSLPNNEWICKNIGTVNMVYVNTTEALFRAGGFLIPKEFFAKAAFDRFGNDLLEAQLLLCALHEIGHTTGCQDPDHQGEPSHYFDAEYSWLEEIRERTRSFPLGTGLIFPELLEDDDRFTGETMYPTFAEQKHFTMGS